MSHDDQSATTPGDLRIADLSVTRGDVSVLRQLRLDVPGGTVAAVLGASGSGKSTLLLAVCGLLHPTSGTITVDGVDITDVPVHRRRVAMVFQDGQLFDHLNVADNIAYGLRRAKWSRVDRRRRVGDLLDLVGLSDKGHRPVTELSGGEAQRVAVARAIAPAPRLLMADEPLSGLDRALHDRLLRDLSVILSDLAITTIWVTHDHDEAHQIARQVHRLGPTGSLLEIVDLRAGDTHDLRRSVLRNDDARATVEFDGDERPDTMHLGVRDGSGRVMSISSWYRRDHAARPGGVQLRSMATATDLQGRGLGDELLAAGCERARAAGAEYVWARARVTAERFYLHRGFRAVGDIYTDDTTGLEHRDVTFDLLG